MADVYQKRILLFLDILGFRDILVDRKDDIQRILIGIQRRAEDYNRLSDLSYTSFSDSITLSAPIKQDGMSDSISAASLAAHACQLYIELLREKILCRGSIVIGDLYHQDGIIFGPAMVRAYEMEQKMAIYPKIAFDQEVKNLITSARLKKSIPSEKRIVREAADGMFYLHPFYSGFIHLFDWPYDRLTVIGEALEFCDEKIEAYSKKPADEWKRLKYNWLKKHLEWSLKDVSPKKKRGK